ncbi:hypothetical protein DFH05DRAFT_1546188 [Lentinula detonsa]|uniref:Uncharacterized protein n=1 Tax=Lentinula detonsa TaxID=2804962 RepID=A0A9W8NT06_9AGAR|nr:hypothetical protein DFH05DRAFT_1546188 [Lentinula detonsa]
MMFSKKLFAAYIHLASFLGVFASPLAAFQRPGSSQTDVALGRRAGEILMPAGITILNGKQSSESTAQYAIVFQGKYAFVRDGNQVLAKSLQRKYQHGVKSLNMQVRINIQDRVSIATKLQSEGGGAQGCTWIIEALNYLSMAAFKVGISENEENEARAWITDKEKELKITESCGEKIARPATAIHSPVQGHFFDSPTSMFPEDPAWHLGA